VSDREAMKLALEALEFNQARWQGKDEALEALRTALAAEPTKPEPVAYFDLQKQVFYWAKPTVIDVPMTVALNPLPLYAAPPTAAPEPTHPGYIIGSHWLETAYSRICAGEAEADVLRDCGWERVTDADALRLDAERWRSFEAVSPYLRRLLTENLEIKAANRDLGDAVMDYKVGLQAASDKNASLHIEIETLRRDAVRYRYLRNRDPNEVFGKSGKAAGVWIDWENDMAGLQLLTGDDADAAIDAAMGDKA
jgi:hypothetical protein